MSLHAYLSEVNRDRLHRIALKRGVSGPSLTFKALFDQVDQLSLNFKRASVISICLDNSIENVVLFLAITAAGGIVAPLNPSYTSDEFLFYLKRSPGGLVVPKSGNVNATAAANTLGLPIYTVDCDGAGRVSMMPEQKVTRSEVISDDAALILFTSGTTGEPKPVPLSHANLIASVKNISATYNLSPSDSTLAVMPLFHIHGLMASLFSTLSTGGCVILPSGGKFAASSFFSELVTNGCTWYSAAPTIHHILLNQKAGKDLLKRHKLRFVRSCSSALAPSVLHQVEAMYGVDVLEAYAMTEASHQMTSNPIGGSRKPGTVGKPFGSVDVKIFSPEGAVVTAAGIHGEICVRGPNVTKGYLGNASANATAFYGAFFRTGDQGFVDADGFLTITGRLKELINRGGEKISPIEIDTVLLSHSQVLEAVAFGMPDAKYGEMVGAAVVLRPRSGLNETDLKTFVASKVIKFKVPERIFIADSLPRTATGKIQRRLVAEKFLSRSKM